MVALPPPPSFTYLSFTRSLFLPAVSMPPPPHYLSASCVISLSAATLCSSNITIHLSTFFTFRTGCSCIERILTHSTGQIQILSVNILYVSKLPITILYCTVQSKGKFILGHDKMIKNSYTEAALTLLRSPKTLMNCS